MNRYDGLHKLLVLELVIRMNRALVAQPRTGGSLGCAPGCDTGGRGFETPTGPTLREEKVLPCNFISKWLDFLVFSDKDDKPEVPSPSSLNVDNSVGR